MRRLKGYSTFNYMELALVKYIFFISLVASYFVTELVVGIYIHSLALQTDAFHMLADLMALTIGLTAVYIKNRETTERYTFGWIRAEVIGGLVNSTFLLSVAFMLFIDSIVRLVELIHNTENDTLEENVNLLLGVAAGGLFINFIGLGLFSQNHSHSHEKKNYAQYAVFLHILGDTLGSLLVIINGLLVKYVSGNWKFFVDPIGSMTIILLISAGAAKLLINCMKILMHHWSGEPTEEIKSEVEPLLKGAGTIHDFHVWSLNNKVAVASLHINFDATITGEKSDELIQMIKDILHNKGIHSSTIQPEWAGKCIEPKCKEDECGQLRCCEREQKEYTQLP